ncbi:hypothetical protein EXIGLDRAFT_717686 [Exidia glandulosa HHB12029]|uniref:Ricin B lectin domain-containing protein n=1 Tax=Exidia glandulosa HHB12029 TaxID=1314781 RepID=A0A165I849_EXIGL|nr:hypothetical protein EXIGLDRAFT_717686 [Exidia glandulosa HHB12029]
MFKLVALFLAVAATVVAQEPDCRTKFAGILGAPVFHGANATVKALTLNTVGQIAYVGDGKSPLVVQFQQCASLNVGLPTDTAVSGRLFVPEKGKCIAVANQAKATGPYYTTLRPCSTEYAQRFGLFFAQNNAIFWTGESDEEGSILQGGCGVLGYECAADGTPVNVHSNKQITLVCDSFKPFWITNQAL